MLRGSIFVQVIVSDSLIMEHRLGDLVRQQEGQVYVSGPWETQGSPDSSTEGNTEQLKEVYGGIKIRVAIKHAAALKSPFWRNLGDEFSGLDTVTVSCPTLDAAITESIM